MKTVELLPNDSHKSFYGKAIIKIDENGVQTLYSYGTAIIKIDENGKLHRIWGGWSATTGRHIKAFCGLNKKEFEALELN